MTGQDRQQFNFTQRNKVNETVLGSAWHTDLDHCPKPQAIYVVNVRQP